MTTRNTFTEAEYLVALKLHEHQEAVSNLADKFLDKALAKGEAFSEGLCNWAINKAERELV